MMKNILLLVSCIDSIVIRETGTFSANSDEQYLV